MSYAPDETDLAIAENVARIARENFADLDARLERDKDAPAEALRRLAAFNLLGLNLPPEHGGQGLTHFQSALCLEEMARVSPDCALWMAASSLGQAYYIQGFGSAEHQAQYLPRICA